MPFRRKIPLQTQPAAGVPVKPCTETRSTLGKVSVFFRRTHMYLGLFLTPWLTMYALSTVVFNHGPWFRSFYGGEMEKFESEKEIPYGRAFIPDTGGSAIGLQIKRDLNLKGNLALRDQDEVRYVFNHNFDDTTLHRIVYIPSEKKLIIEKPVFRTPNFLMRLHSRVGYGNAESPVARRVWGFTVDLSILATVFWIFSGLWMWWELRVTRSWGMLLALVGPALFGLIWWLG
jgi:hypothetical protein